MSCFDSLLQLSRSFSRLKQVRVVSSQKFIFISRDAMTGTESQLLLVHALLEFRHAVQELRLVRHQRSALQILLPQLLLDPVLLRSGFLIHLLHELMQLFVTH